MDTSGYKYLEHTADLKFQSYGSTLDECFVNAAKAFFSAIIEPSSVEPKMEASMDLSSDSLEALMHDWLTEALFLFETEGMVFSEYSASVTEEKKGYRLKGRLRGEKYEPGRHKILVAVKAVTYHGLKVEKKGDKWVAEVLCDV